MIRAELAISKSRPQWMPGAALLAMSLSLISQPSQAAVCGDRSGTDDSDNNSFSFFPIFRSQLNGTTGDDEICGYGGDDLIFGGAGNDSLRGDNGNDRIAGQAGNDRLTGGWGDRDVLIGGTGDDLYFVLDANDKVREAAGEGNDTVVAGVDYILPRNIENLTLPPDLWSTSIAWSRSRGNRGVMLHQNCAGYGGSLPCARLAGFAMGNRHDNVITGNGLDNQLFGLAGDDLIIGGTGSDDLTGGPGNDVLAGFDITGLWWTNENDLLTGGSGSDLFVIGASFRPGGLNDYVRWTGDLSNELFPQYLGQGTVYITDFDWRENDKIEVYGSISDYSIVLGASESLGPFAEIYWDGRLEGYGATTLVGYVLGITSRFDLIPSLDFL